MVSSYVELLGQRYKGQLDDKADRWIGFAVEGAGRMKRLINDLLEFSRVGTHGKPMEPTDCTRVFAEAVANLQSLIEENDALVTCGPLPTLPADPTQMAQLFQNLIGNALKYRGTERPVVHAEARARAITGCSPSGTMALASTRSLLRGFLSSSSGCTHEKNTLGPASVWPSAKRLSSGMGGASGSRGAPARVRRFISRFPNERWEHMAPSNLGRPAIILLVEDNLGDVELTMEALADAKVSNQLHVVPDGMEALAFLRRQGKYGTAPRPDLILLDLNLPKKDGREVLAEIKEDERLRIIPVVVLTTSHADEDIVKSYERHVNSYIAKPVDFAGFTTIVKSIQSFWFSVVVLPPS